MLNGMLSSFRPSKRLADPPEPTGEASSIMVSSQMANEQRTQVQTAANLLSPVSVSMFRLPRGSDTNSRRIGGCARLLQIPNHGVQQREINNAGDTNGDGNFEISGQCRFLCHSRNPEPTLVRFGRPDCEPVHSRQPNSGARRSVLHCRISIRRMSACSKTLLLTSATFLREDQARRASSPT